MVETQTSQAVKKAEPPLLVQIPSSGADQPSWLRVGIIAVIGFGVGIAWPRLAGIKLGPNAPGATAQEAPATTPEPAPSGANAAAAPGKIASAPVASLGTPENAAPSGNANPASSGSGAAPSNGATSLTVKPGILLNCRTETGENLRGKACGGLPFDAIALPRLKRLSTCPATAGNEGKLSPQFDLDFERNKLTIRMGTKNTVGNVDSYSACIGTLFDKVSINAVAHEHARYLVQYNVLVGTADASQKTPASAAANTGTNKPSSQALAADGDQPAAAGGGGDAKIAWDVAIVRDAPRSGGIVGRLQRGTQVQVLATESNWYKVRGGTTEGWLYRGAIGK